MLLPVVTRFLPSAGHTKHISSFISSTSSSLGQLRHHSLLQIPMKQHFPRCSAKAKANRTASRIYSNYCHLRMHSSCRVLTYYILCRKCPFHHPITATRLSLYVCTYARVCSGQGKKGKGGSFKGRLPGYLSPSVEPSPSLDADEPCFDSLTSPGSTSSERWTVNDVLPLLPKPILLFLPAYHRLEYGGDKGKSSHASYFVFYCRKMTRTILN